MKKRVNRCAARRMTLLFLLFCGILVYSGYISFNYWGKILDKYKEKKDLEIQYDTLIDKEKLLKKEVSKLQDPDYIAKYAREKYLYSKDGEYIIKIVE